MTASDPPEIGNGRQRTRCASEPAPRDRTYADGFARNLAGVAELHTLDLDFGGAARANSAVLVLNGWVDWADGSTFRRGIAGDRTRADVSVSAGEGRAGPVARRS